MTATDPVALLEALHAALDADPSDAVTRLMLADLLEDQGDEVGARGQRWQALHGRRPGRPDGERWRWWDEAQWFKGMASYTPNPSDLPGNVFPLLPGGWPVPMSREYPSRRAAEADLAQALEALAVRAAVLAGYDGEPCPWCGERRHGALLRRAVPVRDFRPGDGPPPRRPNTPVLAADPVPAP